MARLDRSLPGRPLTALFDDQAIGGTDDASAAVWRAHKRRMAQRAAAAEPVRGDLRVSSRDPYALRFVAVLAFGMALLFGSVWRLGTVAEMAGGGTASVFVAAGLFGFSTMPIYSVSTAHAHDFSNSAERVELSAALMFLYAVGAIASPFSASLVIERFGPSGMFLMIALAHLLLIIFGVARIRVRPTPDSKTAYTYEPRTSFWVGKLLRRPRNNQGSK